MTSLKERLKNARDALTGKGQPGAPAPAQTGGTTGPLQVIPAPLSHFERQRALIESFDEDHADRWDKAKLFAAKLVALALPIIAVLAIGNELGQYFAQFANGDTFSSALIAYAGEAALAALTYILGSIVGRNDKSASHYIKFGITLFVWALFVAASAWGQWAVAKKAIPDLRDTGLVVAVWVRIGMACSLDAASVAIMFWRGKSLSKFLAQQAQKTAATMQVNEAELQIEAAQAGAEARRELTEIHLEGLRDDQAMLRELRQRNNQAILNQVEGSLSQLPEGGRGGNGRQLRGGSNW
jgi:hypothetical protein